jgi:plastocyanin
MLAVRISLVLACVLGVLAPASAQAPARLTVYLDSYRFAPNPLRLAAGKPVRLEFVNQAGKSHDFTAPLFFAASRILAGNPSGGEVELRGGERAIVELIPAAGRYKVHCSHFLHAQLGMRATIIVG